MPAEATVLTAILVALVTTRPLGPDRASETVQDGAKQKLHPLEIRHSSLSHRRLRARPEKPVLPGSGFADTPEPFRPPRPQKERVVSAFLLQGLRKPTKDGFFESSCNNLHSTVCVSLRSNSKRGRQSSGSKNTSVLAGQYRRRRWLCGSKKH